MIERDTGATHPELTGAIAALLAVVGCLPQRLSGLSQVLRRGDGARVELQQVWTIRCRSSRRR